MLVGRRIRSARNRDPQRLLARRTQRMKADRRLKGRDRRRRRRSAAASAPPDRGAKAPDDSPLAAAVVEWRLTAAD